MKRFLLTLKSYFPTKLPTGATEFNKWSDELIELTKGLADPDSVKFVACSEIMRLPPTSSRKPLSFFVKTINKYAANQVAGHFFTEIKEKQKAQFEAQQAALQASADGSDETSKTQN